MENWMRTKLNPTREQLKNRPQEPQVIFEPGFFSPEEAQGVLADLLSELRFEPDPVSIQGAIVHSKRQSDYRGDPGAQYAYSGVDRDPKPWTPTLLRVKERLESALAGRADVRPSADPQAPAQRAAAASFNAVLCNYYEDGGAGMGWHADKEPDLGSQPLIASLSFGAARPFKFRVKKHLRRPGVEADEKVWEWMLNPGDLLLMQGDTQVWFEHHLPPRAAVKTARINLTFRKVVLSAQKVDDLLAGEAWRQSQAEGGASGPANAARSNDAKSAAGANASANTASPGAKPVGRFMPQLGKAAKGTGADR